MVVCGAGWAASNGGSPDAPPLAPPLRLEDLLREAEEGSPALAAARSRVAAAEAVPSQVEAYPDPVASVSWQNESLTDLTLGEAPDSFIGFTWTQEVPYPGKRDLRSGVARAEIDVARLRRDRARLDLAASIKRAYADLYRIDRSVAILGESRVLLVSFLETTRARYETGEGLLENVLRAQTEITKLDAEVEKIVQERASAQALLNALAGRDPGRPLGPALDLPSPLPLPEVADLEEEALARSPEVLELQAEVRREETRVDLARKDLKPDLIWGASYTNRGDLDPMVMGTFGVRLPLYRGRKQAEAIVQTRREAEAAARDVEAARLQVAAEVRVQAARAGRAASLESLYAQGIIPQARNALDAAAAAYGTGRIEFLSLLEGFRTLLTYEIDREAQRSDRIDALAGLERLTGRALIAVGEAPAKGGSDD